MKGEFTMNTNVSYINRQGTGKLVMPDGTMYSRDSSITGLNNNVAVIGPSGSGKSSVMGVLNAINADSSFIISDPKGGLYRTLGETLELMGYKVQKLDLTHPENSARYNPLLYVNSTQSIRKLAHAIICGADPESRRSSKDPYWENSAESLLCALIGYMVERRFKYKDRTLTEVMKMLSKMAPSEDIEKRRQQPVFEDFFNLEIISQHRGKDSWACRMFRPFVTLSDKTLSCVISTLTSILASFEGDALEKLFSGNDISFKGLGSRKTAVFVIVSDTDRSNDILANLFYTQAMNALCDYADNCCESGALEVPVTFLLDDFSTNCRINGFENIISNIRARNISAIIMLQSISQLDAGYGEGGKTIINNCDTVIFMGANSPDEAVYFSKRANRPIHQMLEMPLRCSWVFRRSEKPRFVHNINPNEYLDAIKEDICMEFASFDELYGVS